MIIIPNIKLKKKENADYTLLRALLILEAKFLTSSTKEFVCLIIETKIIIKKNADKLK